jgi:hypothetical protein
MGIVIDGHGLALRIALQGLGHLEISRIGAKPDAMAAISAARSRETVRDVRKIARLDRLVGDEILVAGAPFDVEILGPDLARDRLGRDDTAGRLLPRTGAPVLYLDP